MGFEAIAPIAGAFISSSSASDAADSAAAGTAEANALAKRQYEETKKLLSPFVNTGTAANNKLAMLLGLNTGGSAAGGMTAEQIRAELLPQFTRSSAPNLNPYEFQVGRNTDTSLGWRWDGLKQNWVPDSTQSIDENGLQAAINERLAQRTNTDTTDPQFGSLLKDFTGADLASEPGYQFGLQQGEQQLDRLSASRGSMLSGGALKALARFNSDYAGTKFNDAFNRDAANKTRTYNFLSGTSGAGQNAAAGTGTAGQNMAQQVGVNTTANATAQGAASIAQGNAWSGALQNISDTNQQNNLLKTIMSGNQSWGTPGYGYSTPYRGPQ